jgi:hypothetical protein
MEGGPVTTGEMALYFFGAIVLIALIVWLGMALDKRDSRPRGKR